MSDSRSSNRPQTDFPCKCHCWRWTATDDRRHRDQWSCGQTQPRQLRTATKTRRCRVDAASTQTESNTLKVSLELRGDLIRLRNATSDENCLIGHCRERGNSTRRRRELQRQREKKERIARGGGRGWGKTKIDADTEDKPLERGTQRALCDYRIKNSAVGDQAKSYDATNPHCFYRQGKNNRLFRRPRDL